MPKTIWDLKAGESFRLKNDATCKALTSTEDGIGLVAEYVEKDQLPNIFDFKISDDDFVFEEEFEFD